MTSTETASTCQTNQQKENDMADEKQQVFLSALERFIGEVQDMKQFAGKSAVLGVLRRIPQRATFNKR